MFPFEEFKTMIISFFYCCSLKILFGNGRLTLTSLLAKLHTRVTRKYSRTSTLALSTVPHISTLQTLCPSHTVLTLTLTSITHPLSLLPTLLPPAPTLTLHLILHLHTGTLLLTLPPTHWALAQDHLHLPHPGQGGHAGLMILMASSTTSSHCDMGGCHTVYICVVRPGYFDNFVTGLAWSLRHENNSLWFRRQFE